MPASPPWQSRVREVGRVRKYSKTFTHVCGSPSCAKVSCISHHILVRPVAHGTISKSKPPFILQEMPRLWDSESLILKLTKQIKVCYSRWCCNIVSLARASIIEEK